jgi:hypothetical protein
MSQSTCATPAACQTSVAGGSQQPPAINGRSQVVRTETCELSQNPEFLNRVLLLRLPEPVAPAPAPACALQCNLFAAPSMDSTAPGAIQAHKGQLAAVCRRPG